MTFLMFHDYYFLFCSAKYIPSQFDKENCYCIISGTQISGFRPNSEIFGKFRKLKNFYGFMTKISFCKASKITPTDDFLRRRRVLEPRYRSMKY